MSADANEPMRLIKLKEVMHLTSLGSTTIYRKLHAGTFPRPRSLSPACVRWLESEVNDWIDALPVSEPVRRKA
jgi:prophage regulatory protein